MNIPLIDEMKKEFVVRRMMQTFFGGAKLKFKHKAPAYAYLSQILLMFLPILFGVFFVVLSETNFLVYPQYMYSYGIIMFAFVLCIQIFSRNAERKMSNVSEVKKKSNSLSESDQIDSASFFSPETIQLLVPPKKHFVNVIFHGLVSAVMCGLCIHFLLPSVIDSSWPDPVAVWLMMIFGWFSLSVAQFPLTTVGAPEPAVYRALDSYEITAVSRALYVIAILSIFSSQVGEAGFDVPHGHTVHLVLAVLPLLWCTNILPPADVLLCWLAEQFLVHFLGGSPQVSNFRLLIMVVLSSCFVLVVHYIPFVALCKIVLIMFSSLLSVNIGLVFDRVRQTISNFLLQKVPEADVVDASADTKSTCSSPYFLALVTHVSLTIVAVVLSILKDLVMWEDEQNVFIQNSVGLCMIVIWILCQILSSLQSVYLFCGAVQNPLYPSSCYNTDDFKRNKVKLQWIGTVRFLLLKIGVLVSMFYLSLLKHEISIDCWSWSCCFYILALVRAYRAVWQNIGNSLLDLIIVHYLYHFKLPFVVDHQVVVCLLFVCIVRDRFVEILHKLYVVTIVTVTSVTLSKQRLWYSWWLVGINAVFLPVLFLIVVTSSIISAPLLPLFTLPIFLFSFPRPVKFWPNSSSAGKNNSDALCSDAVYYKQLAPRLEMCLSAAIRYGSLGSVLAGNQYVLRFEDRMIWLQVLEHGHNYVTIVMKGLELQETSCHTIEAAELDVLFEEAFNFVNRKRCINTRCYNCVTPLDSVIVRSYSDTKNVLTGVIDSPVTLNSIPEIFPKVLSLMLFIHSSNCALEQAPTGHNEQKKVECKPNAQSINSTDKLMVLDPSDQNLDHHSHTVNVDVEEKWAENVADVSWLDDDDPLGDNEVLKRNSATYMTSLSSLSSMPPDQASIPGYMGSLERTDQILMCEWGRTPASDTSKSNDSPELKETLLFEDPPVYHSEQCKYSRIGLKSSWMNTPREKSARWQHLSSEWMQDALQTVLNGHDDDQGAEIELSPHFSDSSVISAYQNIVTSCSRAFFGENGNTLNPANVYRTFLGDLQWTLTAEWLRQNEDLMALALQAYRFSVKLAIDKTLFGLNEEEDHMELYKQTKELMNDWFVGPDNLKAWNFAIEQEIPNLFSLGYNSFNRTYTGHLLTLKEIPLHIGKLNSEMVRAIWASLNFELLYLMNDDEERYSIQAHPVILRNLTVQAADPPLGYPLFISAPITMYI